MKTIAHALVSLATLFAGHVAAQSAAPDCAVSANPGIVRELQPDGREIQLRLRGDGRFSWYEDLNGYPVVKRRDTYLYAVVDRNGEILPTTLVVGSVDARRAGLERKRPTASGAGRKAGTHQHSQGAGAKPGTTGSNLSMSTGTVDNLVLLLRFSNHGPSGQNRTLPSAADVSVIMNAVGGDPILAPTGSVRDYYLEASYDQLEFESGVHGWFDLPESETYYGDGSAGVGPLHVDLVGPGGAQDAGDLQVRGVELVGVGGPAGRGGAGGPGQLLGDLVGGGAGRLLCGPEDEVDRHTTGGEVARHEGAEALANSPCPDDPGAQGRRARTPLAHRPGRSLMKASSAGT